MTVRVSRPRIAGIAFLVGVTTAGCIGTPDAPEPVFYVVRVADPSPAPEPLGGTIVVDPLESARSLDTDRFLVQESSYRVGYYAVHRWTAPPRTLVTEALASHLARSNTFERVVPAVAAADVDLRLTGTLLRFDQVERDDSWWAEVALSLALVESKTRRIVWSGTLEHASRASARHPEAVVEALCLGLGETFAEALRGMREALASHRVDTAREGP